MSRSATRCHHGRRLGERRLERVERAVEADEERAVGALELLGAAALLEAARLGGVVSACARRRGRAR
jgi:hypothetical protein